MSDMLPKMSYSKFSAMKSCPHKYFEMYLSDKPATLIPQDTHRSFIGSATQHVLEKVINDRWYKKESYDTICEMVDADLKLFKNQIVDVESITEPLDSFEAVPLPDAKIITGVQACSVAVSGKFNIHIARNSIIKKIRELYKEPLKYLMDTYDLDLMQSEVILNTPSSHFYHTGSADFVLNYPDHIEILDGKKSASSLLDPDQLEHYKLMAELKYGKKVTRTSFLLYDTCKEEETEHTGDLLERMVVLWNTFKGYEERGHFPYTPSYTACMFCPIKDNCLAKGTLKDDLTEI